MREVHGLLATAFLPEVLDVAARHAAGEYGGDVSDTTKEELRVGGWELLDRAGRLDRIDAWAFHAASLVSYDVQFIPVYWRRAVDYFRGQAGTDRAEDARAALEAGLEYTRSWADFWEEGGQSGWASTAREAEAVIAESIAAFD